MNLLNQPLPGPPKKPTKPLPLEPIHCAICNTTIPHNSNNTPADAICSDDCWEDLKAELQIKGLPSGIPRNDAICILALAGRKARHIAAYFGISTKHTLRIIQRQKTDVRLPVSKLESKRWLNQKP